jgi:exopolysaccharide biosynthesis predicted pyruvyltransferase EpsI
MTDTRSPATIRLSQALPQGNAAGGLASKAKTPWPLGSYLLGMRDVPVYFDQLSGNHGDRLIDLGARSALRAAGARRAADPEDADVIVVTGGAMAPLWYIHFAALEKYSQRFPDTPLLVLPSSYDLTGIDLPALLAGRRAACTLIARDPISLQALQAAALPSDVQTELAHDLAFQLAGSGWLGRLAVHAAQRHILVVERTDGEGVTGATLPEVGNTTIRRLLPARLRHSLKYRLLASRRREQAGESPFVKRAVARVLTDHPQFARLAIHAGDISLGDIASFEEFCQEIAGAAAVFTTRLHVGILAALLGKPTYLHPSSHKKIRGLYDYSLRDMPHVQLLAGDDI